MQEVEANFQEQKNCVYYDTSFQIPSISVIDCIYTLIWTDRTHKFTLQNDTLCLLLV